MQSRPNHLKMKGEQTLRISSCGGRVTKLLTESGVGVSRHADCRVLWRRRCHSIEVPLQHLCQGGDETGQGWYHYRGPSLISNSGRLGSYSKIMPRALWQSQGGGQFCMVPLY